MLSDFLAIGSALPRYEGYNPIPTPAPQAPPSKTADLSPRSKSLWISGGLYAGGGLIGGLIKLGLSKWLPGYASAATPLVNVGTQIAMSPGQQAIGLVTGPISVWGYNFVRGKEQTTQPTGIHGIDNDYAADLIGVYSKRSRLDNWVSGPVSDYGGYQQLLETSLHGMRRRLDAKDVDGAARLLGASLFYDRQIWGQHSPESAHAYELLFVALYPYFEGVDPAVIADLKAKAIAEAQRLDGGKDKGIAAYADAMITGMSTDAPPAQLRQQWNTKALAMADATAVNSETWAKNLISDEMEEHLKGLGWWDRMQVKRQFTSAMTQVVKQAEELEKEVGRRATPDELWRMLNTAFASDAGKKLETKAALISVGMFALLAGGATFGYAHLAKVLPAWSAQGFGTVAPTIISYLSVIARFGIEKFVAFGRALGFAGSAPATLGKGLDRDFRNMRLRTSMVDRRAIGLQGLFNSFTRRIQQHVIDATDSLRAGKIDQAAAYLAGMQISGHTTSYYFWPFSKLMHRAFERLGPYFDGITKAQRDDLEKRVLDRVAKSGASADLIATYHKPFIEGLLSRNVRLAG